MGRPYGNNKPVADFYCENCSEEFELKSKNGNVGKKIVDGAYATMIERLNSDNNPNFFFLTYDKSTLEIRNFLTIPKYFFVPSIIEKRKALASTGDVESTGWLLDVLLCVERINKSAFWVEEVYAFEGVCRGSILRIIMSGRR